MLKFQDKANSMLTDYTLATLPHTISIIGERGSGRHTLLQDMVQTFEIECENITEAISLDKINEIILSNTLRFYLIEIDKISIKTQNSLLKLLEEPSDTNYIVIMADNPDSMLSTIYNRCFSIELQPYTRDQLLTFTTDSAILEVARTPGQIIDLSNGELDMMKSLCKKIFTCIKSANYANCLVLPTKLSYKEGEKGFDCDIFFRVLLAESSKESFERYMLTKELCRNASIPHVDKKKLYENYLTILRQL